MRTPSRTRVSFSSMKVAIIRKVGNMNMSRNTRLKTALTISKKVLSRKPCSGMGVVCTTEGAQRMGSATCCNATSRSPSSSSATPEPSSSAALLRLASRFPRM